MQFRQSTCALYLFGLVSVGLWLGASRPVAAQDCVGWANRSTSLPRPQDSYAMTYDNDRGVMVLVGMAANGQTMETWERANGVWSLRSTSGTPPLERTALAYDSLRGVAVLVAGGRTETWEWDGAAWAMHEAGGSSPNLGRYFSGLAFDSARGVTVQFGGTSNGDCFADTTEWDGQAWTLRAVAARPDPRDAVAMAYDSARGVTVLFGGVHYIGPGQGSIVYGDTWEWDGNSWSLRANVGPSARYGHAMAFDSARGVTVLFGGLDVSGTESNETWEWDGTAWTQRSVPAPAARKFHSMAFDSVRNRIVLAGGSADAARAAAETWEYGVLSDASTAPYADVFSTNRFLSFGGGSACRAQAIRVRFSSLPSPHDGWNGRSLWVGAPRVVSELSGRADGTTPVFTYADLQCEPYYATWGLNGPVHLRHEAIVPGGQYELEFVELSGLPVEGIAPLAVGSNRWGDVAGTPFVPAAAIWPAADSRVDLAVDVVAALDKFANRPGAPSKARSDVSPQVPDLRIDISDVGRLVDAFRGVAYPFAPAAIPCE